MDLISRVHGVWSVAIVVVNVCSLFRNQVLWFRVFVLSFLIKNLSTEAMPREGMGQEGFC